jgi:hypothetical protein
MPISKPIIRLLQIFSARLVLEVFGGAGAIWGFSEAIGLRTPETVWFWRPCALIVGVIFFVRWCMQIQDYVFEENLLVPALKSNEMYSLRKDMSKRFFSEAGEDESLQLSTDEETLSYGSPYSSVEGKRRIGSPDSSLEGNTTIGSPDSSVEG